MTTYAVFGPGMVRKEPYVNRENVYRHLDSITDMDNLIIQANKGVGALSTEWAKERNVPYTVEPVDFRAASDIGANQIYAVRDTYMLEQTDKVILFANSGLWAQIPVICTAIALRKTVLVFHL